MEVDDLISFISLLQQLDVRTRKFAGDGNGIDSSQLYRSSTHLGSRSEIFDFVWKSHAPLPLPVKFFGWLMLQERIQCKLNLRKKHILGDDTCELCGDSLESCDHPIFHCTVLLARSRAISAGRSTRSLLLLASGKCLGQVTSPEALENLEPLTGCCLPPPTNHVCVD